jgi:hypothetical protein
LGLFTVSSNLNEKGSSKGEGHERTRFHLIWALVPDALCPGP